MENFTRSKRRILLCQQETEQDQMEMDRAQGVEQVIVGMAVEPDHPDKTLSSEMQTAAQQIGARQ